MLQTSRILIFVTLSIQLSCNNQSDISDNKKLKSSIDSSNCMQYFAYDEVKYHYIDIGQDSVMQLQDSKKSNIDIKKWKLLTQRVPNKISDTSILENIDQTGYFTQAIPIAKFEQLDQIFCERKHNNSFATTCIATYRDILVFKKNNRIVGTVKICFECGQNVIMGTQQNTDEFGQSGDYTKLFNLLRN